MPNEEKRPPEMLMKKVLKEKYPDMTEANEHIDWLAVLRPVSSGWRKWITDIFKTVNL